MSIQKLEFYEGAALHQLLRACGSAHVAFKAPFFILDNRISLHLKHSTAKRSPWAFTFMPDEQKSLLRHSETGPLVIGLVCGSDGIATLPYDKYVRIAADRTTALRIACSRLHREHYAITGPDGVLDTKIAPSDWLKILHKRH